MVAQHYRYDFIGLSTDSKPTPATSEKVTDGSTFYCSDNSKLYVWYNDQWYEKTVSGGGGATYTAGDNIQISDDNVISATDTTYSNFVGTDGVDAGTAGLVPAPAAADVDKFLKSDGTWDTAGGGGDVVYSDKNTSNSDAGGAVYIGNLNSSQTEQPDPSTSDSHYKYYWALPFRNADKPSDKSIAILGIADASNAIAIGDESFSRADSTIAIGKKAAAYNNAAKSVAIGYEAIVNMNSQNNVLIGASGTVGNGVIAGVGIGYHSGAYYKGSVALGARANTTRVGEVYVGSDSSYEGLQYGFNGTQYRVIGGVHDGQNLHDAATVAQGNTLATSAPTTSTVGVLGQLYTDTTNMHTYQCTAISGDTYTWTQRW